MYILLLLMHCPMNINKYKMFDTIDWVIRNITDFPPISSIRRCNLRHFPALCEVISSADSNLVYLPCPTSWSLTLCIHGLVFSKRPKGTHMQTSGSLSLLPPFLSSALKLHHLDLPNLSTLSLYLRDTAGLCLGSAWALPPCCCPESTCTQGRGSSRVYLISLLSRPQDCSASWLMLHLFCPVV